MGNTDSAISGMQDATRVMDNIPVIGGAFQLQQASYGAAIGAMGGVGKLASSPNMLLLIGGGVLLIMILK